MELNAAFLQCIMEREIPTSELIALANDIWDKSPEEQDLIREQKAKEFSEKYPLRTELPPLPRVAE